MGGGRWGGGKWWRGEVLDCEIEQKGSLRGASVSQTVIEQTRTRGRKKRFI